MEFLVISKPLPTSTRQQLDTVVPDHLHWIQHRLLTGDLTRAGRWGAGGMYIIEAPDEPAARRVLNEDPLISTGLVAIETGAVEPAPPHGRKQAALS